MSYKTLIAAAALSTLPVLASAAVINDGGTTTLLAGGTPASFYEFNFDPQDADKKFEHTFVLDAGGSASAEVSLTTNLANLFNDLMMQWEGGAAVAVGAGLTTATTTFGAGESQTLTISWASVGKNTKLLDGDVTIEVAAVPVPASLLLLGTAIGGLGLARRRKS